YATEKPPGAKDEFVLIFHTPVTVASVTVRTGKADGSDALESGTLEGSRFGKTYEKLATFDKGEAKAEPKRSLKAIRIRPADGAKNPLVIREIVVDSNPTVETFKYPGEYVADVSDAPKMKKWADRA